MRQISDLMLIIYDVLGIKGKNHPILVSGVRTKYNPVENIIYVRSIGFPTIIHEIGHEAVHYLQHTENRLKPYDRMDIEKFRGKKEGMFCKYDFEREAIAFSWVLALKLNEYFFSAREDIKQQYKYHKNFYSSMVQLRITDVTNEIVMEELQMKLDLAYDRAKAKYIGLIENKRQEFINWYTES
ncbi:hypothetical protein [Candidatus Xianfuyuplasma coldseepsis]|uniref:Uncharacterized protein n=1 Tax=Candidatus Xianfuyuplasma coldseepsis TaxID=2782163 RepID=A0A7L7KSS2_9MOLU|nr:hypothetical protein [Xianfuyuplasma coldseepsis]QMS85276.1 hypothetical protein G4Z02_05770 [Xianfuyuplasma coldseepsis]